MAVDQQSPLLLVTARKKRFLDLVQSLCNEFESLHNFVQPGAGTLSNEQRQWSLPINSRLNETDRLSPAERPWGQNTGLPPPTKPPVSTAPPSTRDQLPAVPSEALYSTLVASTQGPGVEVSRASEELPVAEQCRAMKEPESEMPPSVPDNDAHIEEAVKADVIDVAVQVSPRMMEATSSVSLVRRATVQEDSKLEEVLEFMPDHAYPSESSKASSDARRVSAPPVLEGISDHMPALPQNKAPPALSQPTSSSTEAEADAQLLKSPSSGSSGNRPTLHSQSSHKSLDGLLRVGSAGIAGYLPQVAGFNDVVTNSHWTRDHIKTIYERKGFLAEGYNNNWLTEIVESKCFKGSAAALIMLNSIFVGYEQDMAVKRALSGQTELEVPATQALNAIFTALFSIELFLRMGAFRIHFFLGDEWQWNTFDSVIVLSALLEYVLSGLSGFSAMRALRALRLAKTLRIIRVVTVFRNLQLIVLGLMNSLLSLVWMIFLMLLVIYLVSIVFIAAAANYMVDKTKEMAVLDDFQDDLPGDAMTYGQMRVNFERYFESIPRGMYTMFLSVTGGLDWYTIVQPLMNLSWIYAMIFAGFIIFVVFGVFNVLNAVFVEAVLTNRDKDLLIQSEQAKTKVFMKDLANLFKEGDADGSNSFSREELVAHCQTPRFCAYLSTHSLDASDAEVLFEMLDIDGNGTIDIEEFVLGAMKLKGNARCLDMLKAQSNFMQLQSKVDTIMHVVQSMHKRTMSGHSVGSAGSKRRDQDPTSSMQSSSTGTNSSPPSVGAIANVSPIPTTQV